MRTKKQALPLGRITVRAPHTGGKGAAIKLLGEKGANNPQHPDFPWQGSARIQLDFASVTVARTRCVPPPFMILTANIGCLLWNSLGLLGYPLFSLFAPHLSESFVLRGRQPSYPKAPDCPSSINSSSILPALFYFMAAYHQVNFSTLVSFSLGKHVDPPCHPR